MNDHDEARRRVSAIRNAMPTGGMFRDKDWHVSPQAFELSEDLRARLNALGAALLAFQQACDALYHESAEGRQAEWIARLLDQGKPAHMIALAREERWRRELPRVIRPDLIFTDRGVSIAELDSLPGGIGLTAWLGGTYAALGETVIGGATGMVNGFARSFPHHDFLISRESGDYQPEMEWLAARLNDSEGGAREVLNPWSVQPHELAGRSIYRFFELWDADNVEHGTEFIKMAARGELSLTPPMKTHMEEKLWLALFWSPALQEWWEHALSPDHLTLLRECIPFGWVLDPAPLPLTAEYPKLGIQSWQEMKRFGNKERELVIKISGYSETAWGSRGVHIGHDLPQAEWGVVIDEALAAFPHHPHIMQRFHRGRVIAHPYWDDEKQVPAMMQGRVRLCPYYFIAGETVELGGVLATIVPADKKILHGMKDAIMVPCKAGE